MLIIDEAFLRTVSQFEFLDSSIIRIYHLPNQDILKSAESFEPYQQQHLMCVRRMKV